MGCFVIVHTFNVLRRFYYPSDILSQLLVNFQIGTTTVACLFGVNGGGRAAPVVNV